MALSITITLLWTATQSDGVVSILILAICCRKRTERYHCLIPSGTYRCWLCTRHRIPDREIPAGDLYHKHVIQIDRQCHADISQRHCGLPKRFQQVKIFGRFAVLIGVVCRRLCQLHRSPVASLHVSFSISRNLLLTHVNYISWWF